MHSTPLAPSETASQHGGGYPGPAACLRWGKWSAMHAVPLIQQGGDGYPCIFLAASRARPAAVEEPACTVSPRRGVHGVSHAETQRPSASCGCVRCHCASDATAQGRGRWPKLTGTLSQKRQQFAIDLLWRLPLEK